MNNDLIIKIYKRTIILSFFIVGFSFFLFKEAKPVVLGYIFGTAISMLSLKLMDATIARAVHMEPKKATAYSMAHYFLRYVIYAVVLVSALVADYLNFLAAILGLFMVKIIIVISNIFDKEFILRDSDNFNK